MAMHLKIADLMETLNSQDLLLMSLNAQRASLSNSRPHIPKGKSKHVCFFPILQTAFLLNFFCQLIPDSLIFKMKTDILKHGNLLKFIPSLP